MTSSARTVRQRSSRLDAFGTGFPDTVLPGGHPGKPIFDARPDPATVFRRLVRHGDGHLVDVMVRVVVQLLVVAGVDVEVRLVVLDLRERFAELQIFLLLERVALVVPVGTEGVNKPVTQSVSDQHERRQRCRRCHQHNAHHGPFLRLALVAAQQLRADLPQRLTREPLRILTDHLTLVGFDALLAQQILHPPQVAVADERIAGHVEVAQLLPREQLLPKRPDGVIPQDHVLDVRQPSKRAFIQIDQQPVRRDHDRVQVRVGGERARLNAPQVERTGDGQLAEVRQPEEGTFRDNVKIVLPDGKLLQAGENAESHRRDLQQMIVLQTLERTNLQLVERVQPKVKLSEQLQRPERRRRNHVDRVIIQVEDAQMRQSLERVRMQRRNLILAQIQLFQLGHRTEQTLRHLLDEVPAQIQHPQLVQPRERFVADRRDLVVVQVQLEQPRLVPEDALRDAEQMVVAQVEHRQIGVELNRRVDRLDPVELNH
uniref:Uncharacterized protein n=1 Tax=Anopheles farauti TaxID=69004 RepID=A0A182Q898_9DIPT